MSQAIARHENTRHRAARILLVDDDEVDVMAIQRAFAQQNISNELVLAEDGVEALEILRGNKNKDPLGRPYIILLDINMPRMNGHEFLTELRQDPTHGRAVVFVLTTSAADTDRLKAYQHNVAGYIVKNDLSDGLLPQLAEMLEAYWVLVELPD